MDNPKKQPKTKQKRGLPALVLLHSPHLVPRWPIAWLPATRCGGRYAPDYHVRYRSRKNGNQGARAILRPSKPFFALNLCSGVGCITLVRYRPSLDHNEPNLSDYRLASMPTLPCGLLRWFGSVVATCESFHVETITACGCGWVHGEICFLWYNVPTKSKAHPKL